MVALTILVLPAPTIGTASTIGASLATAVAAAAACVAWLSWLVGSRRREWLPALLVSGTMAAIVGASIQPIRPPLGFVAEMEPALGGTVWRSHLFESLLVLGIGWATAVVSSHGTSARSTAIPIWSAGATAAVFAALHGFAPWSCGVLACPLCIGRIRICTLTPQGLRARMTQLASWASIMGRPWDARLQAQVFFPRAVWRLDTGDTGALQALVDEYRRLLLGNRIELMCVGHADWRATDGFNQNLATQRAGEVKAYIDARLRSSPNFSSWAAQSRGEQDAIARADKTSWRSTAASTSGRRTDTVHHQSSWMSRSASSACRPCGSESRGVCSSGPATGTRGVIRRILILSGARFGRSSMPCHKATGSWRKW